MKKQLILPSDDVFLAELDKEAFRVPYDGSDSFYDEDMIKHWKDCWECVKRLCTTTHAQSPKIRHSE